MVTWLYGYMVIWLYGYMVMRDSADSDVAECEPELWLIGTGSRKSV